MSDALADERLFGDVVVAFGPPQIMASNPVVYHRHGFFFLDDVLVFVLLTCLVLCRLLIVTFESYFLVDVVVFLSQEPVQELVSKS